MSSYVNLDITCVKCYVLSSHGWLVDLLEVATFPRVADNAEMTALFGPSETTPCTNESNSISFKMLLEST